jgi:hypothetical protein
MATSLSHGTLVSGYTCPIDVQINKQLTFIFGEGGDSAVNVYGYLKWNENNTWDQVFDLLIWYSIVISDRPH